MHERLVGLKAALVAEPANLRWIGYWLRHRRRTPIALGQPWITFLALEWLAPRLRPDFSILEYGSGGSTVYYGSRCARVVTIEHDPAWAASVRAAPGFPEPRVELRVVPPLVCAVVPRVPSDRFPDPRADFADYASAAEGFPDHSFNVVSVDGRARLACIKASVPKLKGGGYLLLDNSEREDYAAAANLLPGWARHDFFGVGLICTQPWRTTIWQAPPELSA